MTPEAWIERLTGLARSELARLQQTARYRLGAAVREWLRRPWRVGQLVRALAELRRGGTGNTPPLVPLQPLARKGINGWTAERRVLRQLWEQVWAIEASPEFRLGQVLIEAAAGPRELVRLPLSLLKPTTRTPEATPPPHTRPPSVTLDSADRSKVAFCAPPWLGEMLALAGFEGDARSPLLVAGSAADLAGPLRQPLEQALSTARPTAVWIVEGEPWMDPRARAVFAADPGVGAVHLPAAICPRLHNPIGYWSSRPDLGVRGRHEADMPAVWRELVAVARTAGEPGAELTRLLAETKAPAWADAAWTRDWKRHTRMRQVRRAASLTEHCRRIAGALGVTVTSPPLASIVVGTNKTTYLERIFDNAARQAYRPLELVLVLHGDAVKANDLAPRIAALPFPVRLVAAPAHYRLGDVLRAGCDSGAGQVFCRMDDDDWYGAHYVEDFVDALEASDAMLVGKPSYVLYLEERRAFWWCHPELEQQYTVFRGAGPRLAFRREVLADVAFRPMDNGEDQWFVRDCLAAGFPALATDRFNFVYRRRPGTAGHASRRTAAELIQVTQARRLPPQATFDDFE